MSDESPPLAAIVGATATGKTALSIEVARRIGGEIISMDSRQLYRGMDIGTAKPTPAQRVAVPHHGLDLIDPDERFSAGRFSRYARRTIADIFSRDAVPMLVGGTGFFLRALTHPIFREPELDPARRRELESYLAGFPDEELLRWLRALDPKTGERLSDWGGRQRLLRALELPLLTGRPLSWWHVHSPAQESPLRPLLFVIDLPRPLLDAAIHARVTEMIEAGLVEEVASLMHRGFDERAPGMNATGYIELIPYLRGETTLDAAIEEIRRNTRAYARRQLTWFRKQLPEGAVRLDATIPREELADEIAERVATHESSNS